MLFHPTLAIIAIFKQCYGLFAVGLGAENLAGDDLSRLCIAEACGPEEEAHAGSLKAYATLNASVAVVRPPLPLRGGEAGHVEDKAVHGFEAMVESLSAR